MSIARDIRIIVLQRGWVVVGEYSSDGTSGYINKGYVIRVWGTTRGLGQIAVEGPTNSTQLDAIPELEFHELTAVLKLKCNPENWHMIS